MEKVTIDMELPFSCVSESLVQELSLLEPFGKGNTKPVFAARNVELLSGRILGRNKNVLKMQVRDATHTTMEALLFRGVEEFLEYLERRYGKPAVNSFLNGKDSGMSVSVTFYPDINEYRGRITPQIVITHYR